MTLTKVNFAALLLAVSAVGFSAGLFCYGTMERDHACARLDNLSSGCAVGESAGVPSRPQAVTSPTLERQYAGGFRSVRAFEFRGIGPEPNGFVNSGDFEFLNSLEYQVPVRAADKLFVVPFVDSGTVESKVDCKDYRVSAGRGVRIQVPMLEPVPIALDFGFPVERGRPSTSPTSTAG